MAIMRRSILRTLPTATAACIVASIGGIAAAQDVPLSTCFDAVGTYLTENAATAEGVSTDVGRSLLSLTNGGHAFLIDSNERGVDEFAPFSDGLGAWRCLSEDAGTLQLQVTVLDFTFETADHPDQQIARLDIRATYAIETEMLEASASLYFLPLDADPMDLDALPDAFTFAVEGRRVTPR